MYIVYRVRVCVMYVCELIYFGSNVPAEFCRGNHPPCTVPVAF